MAALMASSASTSNGSSRRERKLAHDVRVLDRKRFFDVLPFTHSVASEELRWRSAAKGLELGFFNDLGIGIDLHLQLHYVAALRRSDETRADIGVFLREAADVAGIVIVITTLSLYAISRCSLPDSRDSRNQRS